MNKLDLLNMAGEQLVNMRAWNWTRRAPQFLGHVADQEYVTLPIDCAAIRKIEPTSATGDWVTLTNMPEVLRLRAQGGSGTGPWYAAMTYAGVPAAPRLELYPTPTATEPEVWTLWYSGGWRTLLTEEDVLPFPVWMKPVYDLLVRAVTRGLEEEDEGTMSARIAEVQAGPVYVAAVKRDSRLSVDLGPLRSPFSITNMDPVWPGTIVGPS